jgi:hypothetical protein
MGRRSVTCVVGISTPGKGSLIAFDSLAGSNGTYSIRRDPKGAKLAPWLAFGYTTSYRFGQILAHYLPVGGKPDDPFEWAVRTLVPDMRKALAEHGWLKTESGREEAGNVVFGIRDRVVTVQSDFQVAELAYGYVACGSGEYHALGALHALSGAPPRRHAIAALEAAEAGSAWVRRPWHVLEVKA